MEKIWMNVIFNSGRNSIPTHPYHHHHHHSSSRTRRQTKHRLSPRFPSMVTTRSNSNLTDTSKLLTLTKEKSLYIPSEFKAPLLSPQIWMKVDFKIECLSVREIRTILEVCSIQDDYCRKFEQIQIFKKKVWPKVLMVREKYSNEIQKISDEELIESLLSIEPFVGEKRRFEEDLSESSEVESDHSSDSRPIKKLKISKF
ncbi:hypothetical protein DFH28DRAFT_1083310 [Melampsora americana]|nr:hypothetical protein DFH28DRAFT_1083310 [Melampsora americana]